MVSARDRIIQRRILGVTNPVKSVIASPPEDAQSTTPPAAPPAAKAPPAKIEVAATEDQDEFLLMFLSEQPAEELDKIPGFGKSTIAEILKLRETEEPLQRESIIGVLGESRYQKARNYVSEFLEK